MRNFIDSLLNPVLQILSKIKESLLQTSTVAAAGYDLNAYFGWITLLGSGFSTLLMSLIGSLIFLTVLYMIRSQSRVIIWFKELIGRWF